MADAVLCDEIMIRLQESGGHITVDSPSQLRDELELNREWSKNKVKRAIGSLISRRQVRRYRPEPQGCGDMGRPTTFSLNRL